MPQFLTAAAAELWPELDTTRAQQAQRLISRAEAIITQRFPTVPKRITDGSISLEVVAGVVEDMVTRALDKIARGGMDKLAYPEVQMEWATDGGLSSGNLLWLTTDEVVLLAPAKPSSAFSIRKPPRPVFSSSSPPAQVTSW